MGRAAPDLPDPLENQESAPSNGADDLLSQLAGDEIDRLLAEADVEATPPQPAAPAPAEPVASPAPAAAAAAAATAPATTPALDAQLNELFNALNETVIEVPPAGAAAPAPAPAAPPPQAHAAATNANSPELDAQLKDLFNALNETPIEVPPAEAVAPAPADSEPATKPKPAANTDLDEQLAKLANELLPAPAPEEQAAVAPMDTPAPAAELPAAVDLPVPDERAALLAESPEPAAAEEEHVDEEVSGTIPWFLRPLVWINAPFASMSDNARNLIGKVALATLLFSITVLTFLAVTRHKL